MQKNIQVTPKYSFSFSDWCYGYIFQQLYKISDNRFANAFYVQDDSNLWLINSTFEHDATKFQKEPITFSFNFFSEQNNSFIYNEDPPRDLQKLALERTRFYLGVDEDLSDFIKFTTEFEELTGLQKILQGYRLSGVLMMEWMPLFAFLSTNTTVDMYHTFLMNFLQKWGIKSNYNDYLLVSFPPLKDLDKISESIYRETKIGYRAKYMAEILQALGKDNLYDEKDDAVLLKKLQKIKGIGDYSARTTLLYGMRKYNIAFVDSFVKIVMNHYFHTDLKIANKSLLQFLEQKFSPYQGLLVDWLTAIYSFTNNTAKDKFFKITKIN